MGERLVIAVYKNIFNLSETMGERLVIAVFINVFNRSGQWVRGWLCCVYSCI
jgi:hypothetical protein